MEAMVAAWQDKQDSFFLGLNWWKSFKSCKNFRKFFTTWRGKKGLFYLVPGEQNVPGHLFFFEYPPLRPFWGVKIETYMCCLDSKKGLKKAIFRPKTKGELAKNGPKSVWPICKKCVFWKFTKHRFFFRNSQTHFERKNFWKRTNSSLQKLFTSEKLFFSLAQHKIFGRGLTPLSKKFVVGIDARKK
jgi:hypothetical protein